MKGQKLSHHQCQISSHETKAVLTTERLPLLFPHQYSPRKFLRKSHQSKKYFFVLVGPLIYLYCCTVVGSGDLPDPGITRVYLPPDIH